jgi:hypothetical protein
MMCQDAKILAQVGMFRYIAACGCNGGTVHVSWDVTTLHLCQKDFENFAKVLEQNWPHSELTGAPFNVWIGTVGILLTLEDYRLLLGLVREAVGGLETLPQTRCERLLAALN